MPISQNRSCRWPFRASRLLTLHLSGYTSRSIRLERRGTVAVLSAFVMIVMVLFVALSVDVGYLQNAVVELQRSADAAAMAAAWELVDDGEVGLVDDKLAARTVANSFVGLNRVCRDAPSVDLNYSNSQSGDVVVGYLVDPSDPNSTLDTSDPTKYNAVRVRVRRTSARNGEVRMFFGRAVGVNSVATEATATAALVNNFGGFRAPPADETLQILPIALDKPTWDNLVENGAGNDSWKWNASTKTVESDSDGIGEANLYPTGTGAPGNRGTVDIGGSDNSTSDLARQITDGITEQDMMALGKPLEFDASGKLHLNGDPGISEGLKDELASVVGQTRIIPIFESVSKSGDTAEYTIVQWAGVRVLDVDMTGNNKRVIVQPGSIITRYGIPSDSSQPSSWFVYSRVRLTQ